MPVLHRSACYIVMGVSGSGKTTIGRLLAEELGCPFYDGDDFHLPENVAKMAAGVPLDDDDRAPWLDRLHGLIGQHFERGETAVIACSALKKDYRNRLRGGYEGVRVVFLNGDFDLIWERMAGRKGHFMKAEMLRSQFETLEPPTDEGALTVNIDKPVELVVREILEEEGVIG